MGLSLRQIMRNLTDFFTLRRSKREKGKATSHSMGKGHKKRKAQQQQQEDQHQQQDEHQQQQQQREQQQQEKHVEKDSEGNIYAGNTSMETPDQSSDSYTDLDDEVFEEEKTCSLHACESHATSDGERNHEDVTGLARCFTGSRKHSRTLPPTVIEALPQHYHYQDRASRPSRHRSESHCLMNQNRPSIIVTPASQERTSEITFDESTKETSGGRGLYYFRRPKKATFTVKYTKVYGEADGAYRNDSTPRGLVFVCNFTKFKNDVYSQRVGSDKDYDNMINLFQQLGYDPYHRRRRYCMTGYITKKVFMEKLGAFARELKHKVLCSCVVILMSHGTGPKTFVTSDNQEVDLLEVYKIFDNISCDFLLGKPKIFILQFCRSREITSCREKTSSEQQQVSSDLVERLVKEQVSQIMRKYLRRCSLSKFIAEGGDKNQLFMQIAENSRQASLASLSSSIMDQEQMEEEAKASGRAPLGDYQADTNRIPAIPQVGFQRYSDMYSIFSTSPGELSHRHPEKGSLLIQAICHVFAEYAYQDEIDTLVRRVSTYMTKTLQKDDPITVPRQTCERTNNGLDKLFYFNPYEMVQDRQFTI